jgi:hypothetical protein
VEDVTIKDARCPHNGGAYVTNPSHESIFFDVHCHALNLSHPGLVVFVRRFVTTLIRRKGSHKGFYAFTRNMIHMTWRISYCFFILCKFLINALRKRGSYHGKKKGFLAWIWRCFAELKYVQQVANLLCIMEQDMGEFFMLMDADARKVVRSKVGFEKVALTPLIMDFECDPANEKKRAYRQFVKTKYPLAAKPVDEQILDVLNGIKSYVKKGGSFLEIYPFLGINTTNYATKEKLRERLHRCFGNYKSLSGEERFAKLSENSGKFTGNIENIGDFCFAGVKVYPPLGFDPWPEDFPEELEKVKTLYGFCLENRIPLTTHCSEGGFCVVDKKRRMTIHLQTNGKKCLTKKTDFPRSN